MDSDAYVCRAQRQRLGVDYQCKGVMRLAPWAYDGRLVVWCSACRRIALAERAE